MREVSQLLGKFRIDQTRVARPASVVQESDDRRDSQLAHARHRFVSRCPISIVQGPWRDTLPQHRVAESPNAQLAEAVEIVETIVVPTQRDLIEVAVADPIHGALDPAPNLEGGARVQPSLFTRRRLKTHCTASSVRRAG